MTLLVQNHAASAPFAPAYDVQSWRDAAACRGMSPEESERIFFPSDPLDGMERQAMYDEARSYCRPCPVVQECLDDAIATGDRVGFRGGLSPALRIRRRAKVTLVGKCAECGGGFVLRTSRSRFCSHVCANRDHARRVRVLRQKGMG